VFDTTGKHATRKATARITLPDPALTLCSAYRDMKRISADTPNFNAMKEGEEFTTVATIGFASHPPPLIIYRVVTISTTSAAKKHPASRKNSWDLFKVEHLPEPSSNPLSCRPDAMPDPYEADRQGCGYYGIHYFFISFFFL
jgi:hypothetical protein